MYLQYVHIFKTRGDESIWSFVNERGYFKIKAKGGKMIFLVFEMFRLQFIFKHNIMGTRFVLQIKGYNLFGSDFLFKALKFLFACRKMPRVASKVHSRF